MCIIDIRRGGGGIVFPHRGEGEINWLVLLCKLHLLSAVVGAGYIVVHNDIAAVCPGGFTLFFIAFCCTREHSDWSNR